MWVSEMQYDAEETATTGMSFSAVVAHILPSFHSLFGSSVRDMRAPWNQGAPCPSSLSHIHSNGSSDEATHPPPVCRVGQRVAASDSVSIDGWIQTLNTETKGAVEQLPSGSNVSDSCENSCGANPMIQRAVLSLLQSSWWTRRRYEWLHAAVAVKLMRPTQDWTRRARRTRSVTCRIGDDGSIVVETVVNDNV